MQWLSGAASLLGSVPLAGLSDEDKDARLTLEFHCCRQAYMRCEAYSDREERKAYEKFRDRAVELAPQLTSMSPTDSASFGLMLQFQGQSLWMETGAAKMLDRAAVSDAARGQFKGAQIMAHASDQLDQDDPRRIFLDATVMNINAGCGYSMCVWFTDPKEFDAVCSKERMHRMATSYSYSGNQILLACTYNSTDSLSFSWQFTILNSGAM
jgi:hypothetical protein